MAELKTDYLDDVLDTLQNQLRKYNMIHNDDGTVSFVDVSKYSQNGDNFGAKDINNTNININANTEELAMLKSAVGFTKKQLIPYPFAFTTQELNGVSWKDNGDGTVTANNTATTKSDFILRSRLNEQLILKAGTYILSGCPSGGSETTHRMVVIKTASDGNTEILARDYGEGCTFTLTETTEVGLTASIMAGANANNLTFYPMLRYACIEDDTFEPYVVDLQKQVKTEVNERSTIIQHVPLTDKSILDITQYNAYLSTLGLSTRVLDLPEGNAWAYGVGYVFRRGNAYWITLYGHYTSGSPKIARNYYTNGKWIGWTIE